MAESMQRGNCTCCEQSLACRSAYLLDGAYRCLRCTLQYRPLLRRSAQTSLVVGTLLVAINQGAVLLQGHLSPVLLWEIPLTYLVPFCVSTWGALTNTRR
ncbi:MAG TPA: nitrate/nitrite transporter NrtS [Ktedonobacteraceae bacterium]|nr:nitrate/nitrite transporter NrtS [Ktedonobacteraceae bacterium]